jgi:DNA repair exonuclease SbcCD ATPase subunit
MVRSRRDAPSISIQTEHQRLQAIRLAAEEELNRLRTELTERVAAVERRERELTDALAKAGKGHVQLPKSTQEALSHAQVGLAARAQELNKREAELAKRERALVKLEADVARRATGEAIDPEERLGQIEARLKALQEAEKAFARTQAELAVASDDLARREAALAERERAVESGGAPAIASSGMTRAELAEFEERLHRLEQETREASRGGFGDGLRKLEQRSLGRTPPRS